MGWHSFNLFCYKLYEDPLTWDAADRKCKEEGARLTSIHDEEENEFISTMGITVWIGGNDKNQEGIWSWSNGSVWNFTNWGKSEPNSGGNIDKDEDCLQLHGNSEGKWNDADCTDAQGFVCQM